MPRRALRFLLVILAMWVGVAGTASAHALHAELGAGRADTATTVARDVYDVDLQHARTSRAPATNLAAGSADGERERTRLNRDGDLPVASRSAAESESGLVNLASEARTSHILDGEVRPNGSFGGGHRAGTGFPKKSEFPASWSDDQIMHNISDVATDPASVFRPGRGGDVFGTGTRGGIDIEVLLRNDEIWTGYPTNVPRNP